MSVQQNSVTLEELREIVREMSRESQQRFDQMSEKMRRSTEATDRQIKRTSREVGKLTTRIGRIIEHMVRGHIVDKFKVFGYAIGECSQNKKFGQDVVTPRGEIDLFLENGDVAILIEVKTTLETKDVRDHIERLEKFRRYTDMKGGDKRRFIGAVGGAVVTSEAETFAHENGMYVIVQSGKAVEIVTPPEEFKAREW
ncbi:MAG: hypothetical protein LBI05_09445 [Planctomycetaceae bacterium]|jgi:hypothetical protein|nr:hypothetical protein [Planctomycetaceae bacterium]